MAQYGMRVALAGGVFFLFQIWEHNRGQRSMQKFIEEQQHPGTFTYYDYTQQRLNAVDKVKPLLNVNNFGTEHLEGNRAPNNS